MSEQKIEGLNDQQERFCLEYMKDYNATNAYIRAGYSAEGAGQSASRLLKNAKVKGRLDQLKAEVSGRTGVTIDRVIEQYAKLAFADRAAMFEKDGVTVRPLSEWPEPLRACIVGIEIEEFPSATTEVNEEGEIGEMKIKEGYVRKVKLVDSKTALDSLMKHLGGFQKDNEQKKPVTKFRIGFGKKNSINVDEQTEIENDED